MRRYVLAVRAMRISGICVDFAIIMKNYKLIDLQRFLSSLYESAKIVCMQNGKDCFCKMTCLFHSYYLTARLFRRYSYLHSHYRADKEKRQNHLQGARPFQPALKP